MSFNLILDSTDRSEGLEMEAVSRVANIRNRAYIGTKDFHIARLGSVGKSSSIQRSAASAFMRESFVVCVQS